MKISAYFVTRILAKMYTQSPKHASTYKPGCPRKLCELTRHCGRYSIKTSNVHCATGSILFTPAAQKYLPKTIPTCSDLISFPKIRTLASHGCNVAATNTLSVDMQITKTRHAHIRVFTCTTGSCAFHGPARGREVDVQDRRDMVLVHASSPFHPTHIEGVEVVILNGTCAGVTPQILTQRNHHIPPF